MPLTLTVLRCPDAVAPETRTIDGGEFIAGRGPGVDWVLPDADQVVSKRHFMVAYRAGDWQLHDLSTNGTTINRDPVPLGRGRPRTLKDGDRLLLGPYEIEARLTEEASPFAAGLGGVPDREADPFAPAPFPSAPFPSAPFAADRSPASRGRGGYGHDVSDNPFDEPAAHPPAQPFQNADFDPLAPVGDNPDFASPFRGPVQADHSSSMQDSFRPPAEAGQASFGGGIIPAGNLLPDDLDDLLAGIAPGAPPAKAGVPLPSEPAPPLDEPRADAASPFAKPAPPPRATPPSPVPPSAAVLPVGEPTPSAPAAGPVAAASPTAADAALLAAFMEGVGLADAHASDPVQMMRRLGEAFRTFVSGLRAVLIARDEVRSEFRIEQTIYRARMRNPLQLSADDDDAVTALLGVGRRTSMTPAEAVADALHKIELHELASVSAMQAAVRSLMQDLSPAKLRAAAEQGGGVTLLPGQRKARAWDLYEATHARTVQALSDDFDSVFGKAFARAYEAALDDLSAKGK